MRDAEVAKGWTTLWNAAILPRTCGELHESPVKANERPEPPYSTLMVKKDPRSNQHSATGEIDYRQVTVTTYGATKGECETQMRAIDDVFNDRRPNHRTLTLQFGTVMRVEAGQDGSDTIARGEPRMGSEQQPYKGTLIYRVWISRDY